MLGIPMGSHVDYTTFPLVWPTDGIQLKHLKEVYRGQVHHVLSRFVSRHQPRRLRHVLRGVAGTGGSAGRARTVG